MIIKITQLSQTEARAELIQLTVQLYIEKMIKVDQFCCGCSLETGAIIVGVVSLIMGILYAFMGFAETLILVVDKLSSC